MPPVAVVPPGLRQGAFRGSSAIARGLLTPNQLRGPAWRRLFEDVYIHVDRPVSHALLARVAAAMVVPGSVVTGHSAAVLWGVEMATTQDHVELTVPRSSNPRRVRGVRVRRAELPAGHVQQHRGVAVSSPVATAVRLASSLPGDAAVVAVDQLAAAGLVVVEDVRALATLARGPGAGCRPRPPGLRPGRRPGRLTAGDASATGRGREPLPPPIAQFTIRDAAGFVARVDFAWPEWKVALEYDGLWHAEVGQFARDRRRLNRLHAAGWRVFFVTATDLHDPERLVSRLIAFLVAAGVRRSR